METVACNLCGSREYTTVYEMPDRRFFRDEFFAVVECSRCGLGFLNPRPSIAEIQKYYPPEYYQGPPTSSHDRYLTRRYTRQANYLTGAQNGSARKKLLDVGCANGDFPRFMAARGWEVEGVEISDSTEKIKDFPIYTQELQHIPMDEPTYDAVTAWAVFEHVHDPMGCFQKASRIVKPGGLFVFLVPNFGSIASRHLFCEDIPRHLYFFTRETVNQYLHKTGFTLEREDNGRSIYKMAPYNWLAFMIRTRLLGKDYQFRDVPLTSKEFRRIRNLRPGLVSALKYAVYSPASVIDRMLWPLIETGQMLRKTYGVSTYVARKQ